MDNLAIVKKSEHQFCEQRYSNSFISEMWEAFFRKG